MLIRKKEKLGGFLLIRKKKKLGFLLAHNKKKKSNSRLAPASACCLYSFVPPHREETRKT